MNYRTGDVLKNIMSDKVRLVRNTFGNTKESFLGNTDLL